MLISGIHMATVGVKGLTQIRYNTIGDSIAECDQLNPAHEIKTNKPQ